MAQLARMLNRFQPSVISEIFSRANELKDRGQDILDLSIGEPDFPTPDHVKQAAIQAIGADDTRYTNVDGTEALKAAIARKFKRDSGLDFTPDQIVVDDGAKPLLIHAMQAMLDPGHEVIVPVPCWTSYFGMIEMCGAKPVPLPCPQSDGFKLRPEALAAALTDKTGLLLLNAPGNPTGAAYSRAELRALGRVLEKHEQVWILSDDIYEHIVHGEFEYSTLAQAAPPLRDRILTLNGVSKAYSMTGWRIGYAAGPGNLVGAIVKILSQSTGSPCSISQAAAVAALDGPQDCLAERAAIYTERRDFLARRLNDVPGLECHLPEGAFYLYPSCAGVIGRKTPQGNRIHTSTDFARYLLDYKGVAVVPGEAFGLDPHIRISYAAALDELDRAADRIEVACRKLQ